MLPDALKFERLQHVRIYALRAIPGQRWNGLLVSAEPFRQERGVDPRALVRIWYWAP